MNYFESSGVIGKWVLGIIFFSPLLIAIRSHFIAKQFTSNTVGYGFALDHDLKANQDHFIQYTDFYHFEDDYDRTRGYQSDFFEYDYSNNDAFEYDSVQNDFEINPATGELMIGGLDTSGNAYGCSDHDSHHSSWD